MSESSQITLCKPKLPTLNYYRLNHQTPNTLRGRMVRDHSNEGSISSSEYALGPS